MASPPFNLDTSDPTNPSAASIFPANERNFRDQVASMLAVQHSTTTGENVFPLYTTAQRNALVNPPTGSIVYDTDLRDIMIQIGAPAAPSWRAAFAPLTTPGIYSVPGVYTYIIPTIFMKITLIGAGGGGGSGGTGGQNTGGGGGAAGGHGEVWLSGLTPGNTIILTVGAGGNGGLQPNNNGVNGGVSQIASGTQSITTVQVGGGGGGVAGGAAAGAGGTGSSGNGLGNLNTSGVNGGNGTIGTGAAIGAGGYGGVSGRFGQFGAGGAGGAAATNAFNGNSGIIVIEY